jgi:hypothetical protein
LSGTGAPGKIAIDGADRHLIRMGRRAGPAVGAGAAARLQQLGTDRAEGVLMIAIEVIALSGGAGSP